MAKVRRVFQITERRDSMPLGGVAGVRWCDQSGSAIRRRDRTGPENECVTTRKADPPTSGARDERNLPILVAQDRCPSLAALSASNHQIVGNAAAQYFGLMCGRKNGYKREVRNLHEVH